MKRDQKRTTKFGGKRKEVQQQEFDLAKRSYERRYEQDSKTKTAILGVLLLAVVILLGYYYSKTDELASIRNEKKAAQELAKRTQERQLELGRRYRQYQQKVKDANQAFEAGKYFEAAFTYQQATQFDKNNIELYLKLILAFQKSCELGNDIHCNRDSTIRNKIRLIQEQGSLSLEDKKDSILIQIGR